MTVEFGTGAGLAARRPWHVQQLTDLGRNVSKDLHLVVRAAPLEILSNLADAFAGLTVLDSNAFMKSIHRQRGMLSASGRMTWCKSPTRADAPLDELLAHNWAVVQENVDSALTRRRENGGSA